MSKKYKVIYVNDKDKNVAGLKVGDIVIRKNKFQNAYKLPKHLHGLGHTNYKQYKKKNYWILFEHQVELIE